MQSSLRIFRTEPGFAIAVVLALGLCLGINSALFTIVNALLLRPLPFPESERLVEVAVSGERVGADMLEAARSLEAVGAYVPRNFAVADSDGVRMVYGFRVTPQLIPLLRIQPAHGRALTADDAAQRVAMIGYEYWRSLGAPPDITGRLMKLDGETYSIAGVLGADFFLGVRDAALIVPGLPAGGRTIARLRPGVTAIQAQAEISSLAPNGTVQVTPLRLAMRSSDSGPVLLLLATAGLVLLIACANIANLQLVRGLARRRELAIRTAIGASRARLTALLAGESAALAIAGAAAGLLLTRILHGAILATLPANIMRRMNGADALALDYRVLSFTGAVAAAAVIAFGVLPAVASLRFDVLSGLRETTLGSGKARQRWGRALVAAEIALAVTLLSAAGIAFRSLVTLETHFLGFRPQGVLRAMVDFSATRYATPEQRVALYTEIERRAGAIPGVASVGVLAPQVFPFGGPAVRGARFTIAGRSDLEPRAEVYTANPAYLDSIGLPLLRGRWFNESDRLASAPVAVLSQTLAQRYWGSRECIGDQVQFGEGAPVTVIGVVGDVKNPIAGHWQPTAYRPFAQSPSTGATLMIRAASGQPLALAQAVRRELRAIDSTAAEARLVASLDAAVRDYVSPQRFTAGLLAFFAVAGLMLAAAGVYAVMRYWVASRTPEIGIRVALGAQRSDVVRLVLERAVTAAATGAAVGIGGALAMRKAMSAWVTGIDANDPVVVIGAAAFLLATATVAAWFPARRAASIQPAEALRAE